MRAPVVVQRPSPEPPPATPPAPSTYWSRYRFFARHPRALGAVLVVLGGWSMVSLIDVLLHGGTYLACSAFRSRGDGRRRGGSPVTPCA